MVKHFKSNQISREKTPNVQQQGESSSQVSTNVQVRLQVVSPGSYRMGGGASFSYPDDGDQTGTIIQENSFPLTTHYNSPVPGPAFASVQLLPLGNRRNQPQGQNHPSVTRTISRVPRLNSQSSPRTFNRQRNAASTQTKSKRKVNHRKYTVKRCSNFLRKSLKLDGFLDFHLLEGDRNRRGSTIYLPVGLRIMKSRKNEMEFKTFVKKYLKELENLQASEERKLRANPNEKSRHYIIEFKRAREAIKLFAEGKERKCIEKFFGAHEDSYKERTYLQDSLNFYDEWRRYLGEPIEVETPIYSDVDSIDQYLTL